MRPQFITGASIVGREVEGIANKEFHVKSRVTVASAAVDVHHIPDGTVSSRLVDELRCEVNLGVVRPRVVLWVVLEWTGRHRTDGDVDRGRGRTSGIVDPNRIARLDLFKRWCAPNATVGATEGKSAW